MRFFGVAAVLVGLLVGSVWCQQLGNCPFPEAANITAIIGQSIATADNPSAPTITLAGDFTLVCMAFSEQKDRLRAFSALVQYSCSGNSNCPGGTAIEQFEAECNMDQVWTNSVRSTAGLSRTESPMATASTTPREDCSFCASPAVNVAVGLPRPPDEVTHCVSCDASCALVETTSAMRCFTADATGCCHVYVDGECADVCPDDGLYYLNSGFDCLRLCPDNLGSVENGEVSYSEDLVNDKGYFVGTTASVECISGSERQGEIATCREDGTWSSALANCTEVIDCGQVPSLENGKVLSEPSNTLLGAVVTYECEDNYEFKDERNNRTCQITKTWSNQDLECMSVATCPDSLDPVKNGRVMYSTDVVTLNNERGYAVGTTATVVCDSGYRLFGHSVACLAGRAWNCTLSTCVGESVSSTQTTLIAAVVAGGVVVILTVLAVVAVLGVFISRKRKNKESTGSTPEGDEDIEVDKNAAYTTVMQLSRINNGGDDIEVDVNAAYVTVTQVED